MKSIALYISSVLIIFAMLSVGCKKLKHNISVDDCSEYDYADCDTWDPSYSYIFMEFTINDENPEVPYEIYRGKLEDGNLIHSDTARTKKDSVELDFEIDYTVKAKYKKGGKTIYAIDMDKATKWSQDVCDSTCWHYIDAEVDLRLR